MRIQLWSKLIFTAGLAFAFATASGWAQPEETPLTLYKLNPQAIRDNNMAPLMELTKEDTLAGSFGRLAAHLDSGVEVARHGYHRQLFGRFDLHVREADMNAGGQGIKSSIYFDLVNHLKLDLTNDAPLSGPSVQSANLTYQLKIW